MASIPSFADVFLSPERWGMIAKGAFQPTSSQTLLGLVGEYKIAPFCNRKLSYNPKIKKKLGVGGPAQDLPKFQTPCLTPKSVQTCSIYSPDGDCKVSLKKIDLFMTNGCPIVSPPEVTSD